MGYGMNGNVKAMGSGMSPRKEMAGGTSSGNFGVGAYPAKQSAMHPDAMAKTGMKPHMADHERAIGMPVSGKEMPMQAAADHGPMHEGKLGFKRGGKI